MCFTPRKKLGLSSPILALDGASIGDARNCGELLRKLGTVDAWEEHCGISPCFPSFSHIQSSGSLWLCMCMCNYAVFSAGLSPAFGGTETAKNIMRRLPWTGNDKKSTILKLWALKRPCEWYAVVHELVIVFLRYPR